MGETNLSLRSRYGGNGDETEGMHAHPPVSPQARRTLYGSCHRYGVVWTVLKKIIDLL